MRILLDEDVHIKLTDWLVEAGHDVKRVPLGLKNGQVIALARQESRVLVTRDKDFANRLLYPPHEYPGIIVLRVHPPELERLVAALRAFLVACPEQDVSGKLAVVEEGGYHLDA